MKGKTASGFEYKINKARLDNFELAEAFKKLEDDPLMFTVVTKLLLGVEQTKKLKDHVRDEDGIVPIEKMTKEIKEIMDSQPEIKK